MKRSFRFQLALRFGLTMAGALIVLGILTLFALREALDREIDATLLEVASVQARAATEPADGEMRLVEWELTPEEAEQLRDLNRYTQIWAEDGSSLLRTRYLTQDLPRDGEAIRRAAEGELAWAEDRFQGMSVRSLFYPLERFGEEHEAHVLQVAAPLESRNRMLRGASALGALLIVVVSAGTFGGGWWLADRTLRPVQRVTSQAEEIGGGTLGRRITAHADTEEYERLVQVLNGMLGRIDEAFEAQKRFAADAGHELRSPITALRGEIEVALGRERSPEEYRRVLGSALEEVERLSSTADDLLTLARSEAGVMEPRLGLVDLAQVVSEVVERVRGLDWVEGEWVSAHLAPGAEVLADEGLLRRLCWNLVENAAKFTPEGGALEVRVERRDDGSRVLEVSDTGPGLAEEDLDRIFEPFFRGDSARARSPDTPGTGLGLAIARAVAELHGGELTAVNRSDGPGAVFRARFPRPYEDSPAEGTLA